MPRSNTMSKEYRAQAQAAREKAATEPDDAKRKVLRNDADLYERMADYEDKSGCRER